MRVKIGFTDAVISQPHMLLLPPPIRPFPSEYPLIWNISVIGSLKKEGFEKIFDIDWDEAHSLCFLKESRT